MKDRPAELSSPMALPIHPHLVYPKQSALAGQPLRAVGVVGGRPVWPVLGGAPEDDNSSGSAGTGEGDSDDDGSGGSKDGDDASKKQSQATGNPEGRIKALEEEKDRQYQRRQKAETELTELQKRLKEFEDKDKSELEKAQGEMTELTTKVEGLESANRELMLQVAFLSDNTYTWQNPKRALQLADLSSVEFKDGKATGLDKALEALAQSDPYLLKVEDKKDDEGKGGPTGKTHNGKKSANSGPDLAELRKKYPALRGR